MLGLSLTGVVMARVSIRVSSITQNRTIDTKKPRSEGVQHVFSVIGILK